MQKQVWICIEKADGNYSAYAPAVLGCVTTGETVEETRLNMAEALAFHLEGMLEDGESIDSISEDLPLSEMQNAKDRGDKGYYVLVAVEIAGVKAGV